MEEPKPEAEKKAEEAPAEPPKEEEPAKEEEAETAEMAKDEEAAAEPKKEEPASKDEASKEEKKESNPDVEMADAEKTEDASEAAKDEEKAGEPAEEDAAPTSAGKAAKGKKGKKKATPDVKKDDAEKKRKATPPQPESSKRERRERKSAEAFKPEDYINTDRSVKIVPGRGKPLGELKACAKSIESHKDGAGEIALTHKLLFTTRGKPPKKDLKANILAFSGYLSPKEEGLSKEEQDKKDEEQESKMGVKAYKLTIPQLKQICDFLGVDRSGKNAKDELVDILLDFLGEPSDELLKSEKGSSSAAKKNKKAKAAEDEHEEEEKDGNDSYSDVDHEKIKEGDEPNDEALRKWVRAYVRCFSMKKSTIKHALEVAGEKFGVDLSDKKQRLKELLTEEM